MATFSADQILSQMDQAARGYRFLMLDNGYYYPVDQRLHAFRDQERWAVVIEALVTTPGQATS